MHQANYQTLMDTFPEDSQGSSTFESLSTHHLSQVPKTVPSIILIHWYVLKFELENCQVRVYGTTDIELRQG